MPHYDPELPIPEHVAIIMDGNGRWAKGRGKIRNEGHREGAKSVEAVLEAAKAIGIRHLTLYAFSSENWKRPEDEVSGLMGLLSHFLKLKTPTLIKNDIRLKAIGAIDRLPPASRKQLDKSIADTAHCESLTCHIALSYGSREEIVRATQTLMQRAADGEMTPEELSVENFGDYLYTSEAPDPDLLVRTSGEFRISNFLLWQISYSEIHITDVLWPDFRHENLELAVADYQKRHRRYGGL